MAARPDDHRKPVEEGRAVIGKTSSSIHAHVDPGCPYYPTDPRPITEEDRRRSLILMCDWCEFDSDREYHPETEVLD